MSAVYYVGSCDYTHVEKSLASEPKILTRVDKSESVQLILTLSGKSHDQFQ